MIANYLDTGTLAMHHYYLLALCGIWRHEPAMCSAGTYRVIGPQGHFDAVMDDFGTLVEVA